jgi:homoserine O-acetyltransferase/O-succinyltransferase
MRLLLSLIVTLAVSLPLAVQAQTSSTASAKEDDYVAPNFKFKSGETLAELRLHYTTLGEIKRDANGRVINAVLILHGTGGDGHQFYRPQFADVLFASGGLLDPAKYFIVLPDGIGHGKSSKPSDGLKAKFPQYDYDDMVAAHYELLTKGVGVDHLRLVMGTSMGCMHSFVWGETHPDFMDALLPLACLPVEIAGRNRVWRKMVMDAIRSDPDWQNGDYTEQPREGLRTAISLLILAGGAPVLMQASLPTRDAADKFVEEQMKQRMEGLDANDLWFQVNASRSYNPGPMLGAIKAPMVWINSADDFINPPELGIAEREAQKIKSVRYVLLPASNETRGHGSHTWAVLWQEHLAELLHQTERAPP